MISSQGRKQQHEANRPGTGRQLLPTLVAVGGSCGLAAGPAGALELGELSLESALGEPLRASIAYALQPHETIGDHCVFLRPPAGTKGLPGIGNPRITITDRAILLRGRTPVREPLLSMRLSVECPQAAKFAREFTLLVDLPVPVSDVRVAMATDRVDYSPAVRTATDASVRPDAASNTPVISRPQSRQPLQQRVGSAKAPISAGSGYRVEPGDSLSQIAARIEGRTVALWPAVDAIFAANPDAFLNNDRDQLRAGAWLQIPALGVAPAAEPYDADTVAPVLAATGESLAAIDISPAAATLPASQPEAGAGVFDASSLALAPEAATVADAGSAPPAVDAGPRSVVVVIPDTTVAAPTARPALTDTAVTQTPWMRWFAGIGMTIVLTLLIFSRQIRDRFGSGAPALPAATGRRRRSTEAPQTKARPASAAAAVHTAPKTQHNGRYEDGPLDFDFSLPIKPARQGMEIKEIPPANTTNIDHIDLEIAAQLHEETFSDDDPTAKDLQSLSGGEESPDFSIVNDVERQVFEQDFEAAMIATGHFKSSVGEFNDDDDIDSDDETVKFPSSKVS